MNTNELADSLEAASSDMEYNFHVSDWKLLYECALVMRKQQAEIEALKKFSRWAYRNLTQTALQYELLGGRSEFDVNELWKLLEDKK